MRLRFEKGCAGLACGATARRGLATRLRRRLKHAVLGGVGSDTIDDERTRESGLVGFASGSSDAEVQVIVVDVEQRASGASERDDAT
jgi:hypothetical protein